MNTLEILRAGRELISDPKRWTTGYYACDGDGMPILPQNPRAVCFCSLGAIERVSPYQHLVAREQARDRLFEVMGGGVGYYNDNHTHTEVLARWDEAIAKLEAA